MATTGSEDAPVITSSKKNKVMARVHCNECKGRFIVQVEIKGLMKRGVMSETPCKKCKEKEITSYLIFDKKY